MAWGGPCFQGATGNGACLETMVGSQAPGWEWGAGLREGQSPAVLHQVLHDLVQHFLDQRCAHPYVLQGLQAEGWGLPAGRALSPQGLLVACQGFPAKREVGSRSVRAWGQAAMQTGGSGSRVWCHKMRTQRTDREEGLEMKGPPPHPHHHP